LAWVHDTRRRVALGAVNKGNVKSSVIDPFWNTGDRGLIPVVVNLDLRVVLKPLSLHIEPLGVMLKPDDFIYTRFYPGKGAVAGAELDNAPDVAANSNKQVVVSLR
jgi:hypothetical protein